VDCHHLLGDGSVAQKGDLFQCMCGDDSLFELSMDSQDLACDKNYYDADSCNGFLVDYVDYMRQAYDGYSI